MFDLDRQQAAAVHAGPIDLFIAAGAGSGKTRVLTARFAAAIQGDAPYQSCQPGELLAVTYTDKAAGELAERIRGALARSGHTAEARAIGDAWISTIHGMCSRILRRHALDAGLDPYFGVLDPVEAAVLRTEALEAAARVWLEHDEHAPELVDEYGLGAVVGAIYDVFERVRAMGLDTGDVQTLSPEDGVEQLRESHRRLTAVERALGDLRSPLKTVAKNRDAVRRLVGEIAAALGRDGEWESLREALASPGLRHACQIEGLDPLIDEAGSLVDAALRAVAQLEVTDLEQSFLCLVAAYGTGYQALKASRAALDFEDLQHETVRLLETAPEIAEQYRSHFKMLMLDEFQDTNDLQLRLIERLSRGNLCTVGDEQQSIYSFRHADVEVFRSRGEGVAERRELNVNYRTEPTLLDGVNGLFSQDALFGASFRPLAAPPEPKERRPWPGDQARLEVRLLDKADWPDVEKSDREAECVATRVAELVRSGIQPGDIAVLMRAISGGRGTRVERSLLRRGIPVHLSRSGAFFECPEIMQVRALLRLISNVRDDEALLTTLAGELGGLSLEGLLAISAETEAHRPEGGERPPLWEALVAGRGLGAEDSSKAGRLVLAVEEARRGRGVRPLRNTVLEPLLALDYEDTLSAFGDEGARAWANVLKLTRLASEFEQTVGGDLGAFLDHLDLTEQHGQGEKEATLDGESDAVRIMSIHGAKGLEFPVVVLATFGGGGGTGVIEVSRVDGRPLLGMKLKRDGAAYETLAWRIVAEQQRAVEQSEMVRLLYVGCTRAEESLTVLAATELDKEADEKMGGLVRTALEQALGCPLPEGDAQLSGSSIRISRSRPGSADEPAEEPLTAAVGTSSDPGPASGEAQGGQTRTDCPERRAPRRISYTGLAAYERCPYRFYLRSIAHLPDPPAVKSGDARAFGNALHLVLQKAHGPEQDLSDVIAWASRANGMGSSEMGRLAAAVDAYLRSALAHEMLAADRLVHEAPIAVRLGDTVLAGSIDAIAWRGDEATIVDYKTGAAELGVAEARQRYELQGKCYALAAFRAGAVAVRVVFAEVERARETAYDYVPEDVLGLEAEVSGIIERMAREGYPSRGTYDATSCETCPGLEGLCPVTRPSRGVSG